MGSRYSKGTHVTSPPGASYGIGNASPLPSPSAEPSQGGCVTPLPPASGVLVPLTLENALPAGPACGAGTLYPDPPCIDAVLDPPGDTPSPGVGDACCRSSALTKCFRNIRSFSSSGISEMSVGVAVAGGAGFWLGESERVSSFGVGIRGTERFESDRSGRVNRLPLSSGVSPSCDALATPSLSNALDSADTPPTLPATSFDVRLIGFFSPMPLPLPLSRKPALPCECAEKNEPVPPDAARGLKLFGRNDVAAATYEDPPPSAIDPRGLSFAGDPVVRRGMFGIGGGVTPYGDEEKGGFLYEPGMGCCEDMLVVWW